MTGSEWSAVGVAISFVGAMFAWYGTRVSGHENRLRGEEQLGLTRKALVATEKLEAKNSELAESSAKLAAKSDQLAAKSEEIANLNREIADLSKKSAAFTMGTGSLFYLHVRGFGGQSPEARIVHVGDNPVRDTEILIFDVTAQIPHISTRRASQYDTDNAPRQRIVVRASYPRRSTKLTQQVFEANPTREAYTYLIYLSGANGSYRQILQLAKVGDVWRQAYRIQETLGRELRKPIGEYFDKEFPSGTQSILQPSAEFPDLDEPK
jgi:hypothetical protein